MIFRRKRIGIMLVTIDQYYQKNLWQGMEAKAKTSDVDLLFFCGSPFEAPYFDVSHYNSIYNLINTNYLDGVIIISSGLGNYVGKEKLKNYIKHINDVPILSLSFDYEGYQTLEIDNYNSMIKVMEHLIVDHQYKEIGIITGPMTNVDAVERFEAYRDSLETHGISFDEDLVAEGQFNQNSALIATKLIFEKRGRRPEVLVCCNDDMAIGAYFVLEEMGLKVGQDVYLTGFDDLDEVDSFNPPFTTVRLPWFEMGYQGLGMLLDRIESGDQAGSFDWNRKLSGDLIIRESCGCLNVLPIKLKTELQDLLRNNEGDVIVKDNFNEWIHRHVKTFIAIIINQLEVPIQNEKYSKSIIELLDAFSEDVNGGNFNGKFVAHLNLIISREGYGDEILEKWQDALYATNLYMQTSNLSKDILLIIDNIFYLANTVVGNIIKRIEHHRAYEFRALFYSSSMLTQSFNTVLTEEELFRTLNSAAKNYGLELLLCLFDKALIATNNGQFIYPEYMSVGYGIIGSEIYSGIRYKTNEMLPFEISNKLDRSSTVFFPIQFKERHFGYIITNTISAEKTIFRTMREQIGNTLDRIYVYKKLEEYNHELEIISMVDALTGLYNRRGLYDLGEEAFEKARLYKEQVAIIYGDIDGLKIINDHHGHHEGDYAISFIGKAIKASINDYCLAGRVGGDEFIIIIEHFEGQKDLDCILHGIQALIEEENEVNNKPYEISISFGYKVYDGLDQFTFDELIISADHQLYIEKKRKKAHKAIGL